MYFTGYRPSKWKISALTFIIVSFHVSGASESDEKKLVDHLLRQNRYNHLLRPKGEVVDVVFHIIFSQLIGLNEREQYMITKVWMPQKWQDSRLTWDPQNFSNIQRLQLPSTKIWLPDIVLYNNNDGKYETSLFSNAIVTHSGQVSWKPTAIFRSTCNIKVAKFPFDRQNCRMVFRSWTYSSKDLNLTLLKDEANMDAFTPSGEWQIERMPARKTEFVGSDSFQEIIYSVVMERKPLFYIINLIIPCILITVLAILVFCTPSDCGEKMTLCISVLLALTVFLLLLSKMVPPTSLEVPLIGKYLLFTMTLVTSSVIMSVVVLNVHHRTIHTHNMPKWIRFYFLEILPALILQRPEQTGEKRNFVEEYMVGISGQENLVKKRNAEQDVLPKVENILYWTAYAAASSKRKDDDRKMSEDWKFVAMTLDRLLFILFTLIFCVGSVTIFLESIF